MSGSFTTWEEAVLWLRGQADQQELVRACYYDDPLAAAAERYHASAEWAAVRALLGSRVGAALDLGAGRGIAAFALARDGFAVTALEPDPSAVVGAGAIRALAAAVGVAIAVVQEAGERLPFADASFDVVVARAVLHHARDLAAMCREIARVLKPGGRLVAAREHVISRPDDLPAFLAAHPLHRLYGGEHAFTLGAYRAALTGVGLRLARELRPLASPINYAPRTMPELRAELAQRVRRLPLLGPLAGPVLALPPFGALAWWLADHCDSRPGRLYTFVGDKS